MKDTFFLKKWYSINNQSFNRKERRMMRIIYSCTLLVVLTSFVFAVPDSVVVNGLKSGAVITQGGVFEWKIYVTTPGETVSNELWIDINGNGSLDQGVDLLWTRFTQTDGVSQSSGGPGDMDGIANKVITAEVKIGLAPAHYIFVSTSNGGTASAHFEFIETQTYTFTIRGRVQYTNGEPAQNVFVVANARDNSTVSTFLWSALTNNQGYYSIRVNEPIGSQWEVKPEAWSGNYVCTPSRYEVQITSDYDNVNFTLLAPKVITGIVKDVNNNPLVDVQVEAREVQQNSSVKTSTDVNGRYHLEVADGKYFVTFKKNGYIITTYDQKYVEWLGDTVFVSANDDTVKNINGTLARGGVITGTITGGTCEGINAFRDNTSGQPFAWIYPGNQSSYTMMLPAGTYYIFFWDNETQTGIWYNQVKGGSMAALPTAITVGEYPDTVRNINVDFSLTDVKTEMFQPNAFTLFHNYPNPFNPSTTIEFTVPVSGYTKLKIVNVLGQIVCVLHDGMAYAGQRYQYAFNAENVPSGVYFALLEWSGNIRAQKLLLLK